MFANSIYKFFWRLLLLLVSLYEVCVWLRFRVIAFALWSYDLCQTEAKRKQNECEFLRQCTKHLNKIPKHLNLIIGPEAQHVNEELLSRIFTYALYMNIECLSYYDTRLDSNDSTGVRRIPLNKVKCPDSWRCKSSEDRRAVWHRGDVEDLANGLKQANGHDLCSSSNNFAKSSNGNFSSPAVKNNNSLEIYEILPNDNRPLIAQVFRDLFRRRHTTEILQKLKTRSLLTSHLDQELMQHLRNLSEPELSIVFHENLCTFGLLPWHARFTEFHCHEPRRRFDVESFARILYKYSRCEQRWGK